MTTVSTMDRIDTTIESIYLNDIKKIKLPAYFLSDVTGIVDVSKNHIVFIEPYIGDYEWAIDLVKSAGMNRALVNFEHKVIVYNFDTKKFVSMFNFYSFPKVTNQEYFIIKDIDGNIFKCLAKSGFNIITWAIYNSRRLNSYKATYYGKTLFIDMITACWNVVTNTRTNNIIYSFDVMTQEIREVDEKCMKSFDKILEKVQEIEVITPASIVTASSIPISQFMKLTKYPTKVVDIKDDIKSFPSSVTSVTFLPTNRIRIYYYGTTPPCSIVGAESALGILDKGFQISFLEDKFYNNEDGDDELSEWNKALGNTIGD
jgi:hypothetical protein